MSSSPSTPAFLVFDDNHENLLASANLSISSKNIKKYSSTHEGHQAKRIKKCLRKKWQENITGNT